MNEDEDKDEDGDEDELFTLWYTRQHPPKTLNAIDVMAYLHGMT